MLDTVTRALVRVVTLRQLITGEAEQPILDLATDREPITVHADARPRGGWCRLPDGIDALDVARRGLAETIIFAPGNVFSLAQSASGYLRFNAAMSDDRRIVRFLERVCC